MKHDNPNGYLYLEWTRDSLDAALAMVDYAVEHGTPGAMVVKARVSAAINAVNYLLGE